MNTGDARLGPLLGLLGALLAVSGLLSWGLGVPFLAVLKPLAGLTAVGLVVGWTLDEVVEFNPYEY